MKQILIQLMKAPVLMRLANQLKTVFPDVETFKKASKQNEEFTMTDMYGIPDFVHFFKNAGAMPVKAIE
jgi:hypothetical protein